MKYKTKIFLSLTLIAFSISTVYAGDYIFTGTTTLSNKIVNNNVTNPAFKVERSIGRYFNTYIMNARNITGQNASGGIRAFVTVKRKKILYGHLLRNNKLEFITEQVYIIFGIHSKQEKK